MVVSGGPRGGETVAVDALGLAYPVIVSSSPVRTVRIASGNAVDGGGDMMPQRGGFPRGRRAEGPGDAGVDDGMISLRRYDFVVQLVWQPRTPGGPEPVMPDSEQSEETDN